jgi:hypothetical protein
MWPFLDVPKPLVPREVSDPQRVREGTRVCMRPSPRQRCRLKVRPNNGRPPTGTRR